MRQRPKKGPRTHRPCLSQSTRAHPVHMRLHLPKAGNAMAQRPHPIGGDGSAFGHGSGCRRSRYVADRRDLQERDCGVFPSGRRPVWGPRRVCHQSGGRIERCVHVGVQRQGSVERAVAFSLGRCRFCEVVPELGAWEWRGTLAAGVRARQMRRRGISANQVAARHGAWPMGRGAVGGPWPGG